MKTTLYNTQNRHIKSEYSLVKRVILHLGQEGYRIQREVPVMGQSADIVATKHQCITVIEAKLHDWRRALLQCRAHEQVADYVCIAIGTVSVSDILISEAIKSGYGIIHCPASNEICRWEILPKINNNFWPPQRNRLKEIMRSIKYEH